MTSGFAFTALVSAFAGALVVGASDLLAMVHITSFVALQYIAALQHSQEKIVQRTKIKTMGFQGYVS